MATNLAHCRRIQFFHNLYDICLIEDAIGGERRFDPALEGGVLHSLADSQVLQTRNRRRRLWIWLASFGDHFDVDTTKAQFVPASWIAPDDFDPIVRRNANQRIKVVAAHDDIDVLGESFIAMESGGHAADDGDANAFAA